MRTSLVRDRARWFRRIAAAPVGGPLMFTGIRIRTGRLLAVFNRIFTRP